MMVRKAIFERSYIAMYWTGPFAKFPGMTIMELLKAWCVIDDLAERLPVSKAEHDAGVAAAAVERAALCVTREELVTLLQRALGYDATTCEAVINFLSWTPATYKGLWGAPLIPIPGESRFALARNVLATTDSVRLAEIWFTAAALTTACRKARAATSMRHCCIEIAEEMADNEIIQDWSLAPHCIAEKGQGLPPPDRSVAAIWVSAHCG